MLSDESLLKGEDKKNTIHKSGSSNLLVDKTKSIAKLIIFVFTIALKVVLPSSKICVSEESVLSNSLWSMLIPMIPKNSEWICSPTSFYVWPIIFFNMHRKYIIFENKFLRTYWFLLFFKFTHFVGIFAFGQFYNGLLRIIIWFQPMSNLDILIIRFYTIFSKIFQNCTF